MPAGIFIPGGIFIPAGIPIPAGMPEPDSPSVSAGSTSTARHGASTIQFVRARVTSSAVTSRNFSR